MTPANTVSRPSSLVSVAGSSWPVAMPRKPSTRRSASLTVLPLTATVIIDAEALQIAHDSPSNPISPIRSPSSFSATQMWSPHSGFRPSERWVAPSSLPQFRGFLLWSRMTSW